jgi:HJR/Mrr/RecB family endonuclease
MARRRSLFPRQRRISLFPRPKRRSAGAETTLIVVLLLLGALVYAIENFWPVLLVAGIAWGGWQVAAQAERQKRLRALRLADVDSMSGPQFEAYLVPLFRHQGYEVRHTGGAGDQGCDLLLEKAGRHIACQAKRYNHRVTNDAVAEAVAAKAFYGCNDAMVVTTSRFTRSARKLAQANGCDLIDRDDLADMIRSFSLVH